MSTAEWIRAQRGVCIGCGAAPPAAGKRRCQGCLDALAADRAAGVDAIARRRAKQEAARAERRCSTCLTADVSTGGRTCDDCRARSRASQEKRRRAAGMATRAEYRASFAPPAAKRVDSYGRVTIAEIRAAREPNDAARAEAARDSERRRRGDYGYGDAR